MPGLVPGPRTQLSKGTFSHLSGTKEPGFSQECLVLWIAYKGTTTGVPSGMRYLPIFVGRWVTLWKKIEEENKTHAEKTSFCLHESDLLMMLTTGNILMDSLMQAVRYGSFFKSSSSSWRPGASSVLPPQLPVPKRRPAASSSIFIFSWTPVRQTFKQLDNTVEIQRLSGCYNLRWNT